MKRRQGKKIKTTFELVEVIKNASPRHRKPGIPVHDIGYKQLARIFQALRIAVNDELDSLKEGVNKAWEMLSPGGRLVVISFHSLEDRIIKNFFKEEGKEKKGKILTKKPITPSEKEKKENPRSRSAKLRAIEKI